MGEEQAASTRNSLTLIDEDNPGYPDAKGDTTRKCIFSTTHQLYGGTNAARRA